MIFNFLFFVTVGHFGSVLLVTGQEHVIHEQTLKSNAISVTGKSTVMDLRYDSTSEFYNQTDSDVESGHVRTLLSLMKS